MLKHLTLASSWANQSHGFCVSQALKARAQQGYQDGSLAVQQLYNALNLQKEVAHSQVAAISLQVRGRLLNEVLEGIDFWLR